MPNYYFAMYFAQQEEKHLFFICIFFARLLLPAAYMMCACKYPHMDSVWNRFHSNIMDTNGY